MSDPTLEWKGVTYSRSQIGADLFDAILALIELEENALIVADREAGQADDPGLVEQTYHAQDLMAMHILFYGLESAKSAIDDLLP